MVELELPHNYWKNIKFLNIRRPNISCSMNINDMRNYNLIGIYPSIVLCSGKSQSINLLDVKDDILNELIEKKAEIMCHNEYCYNRIMVWKFTNIDMSM